MRRSSSSSFRYVSLTFYWLRSAIRLELVAFQGLIGAEQSRISGSLGKPNGMPRRIAHEFALRYVGDIAPPEGDLHNALALSCEKRPAGTGFRILLDAVNVVRGQHLPRPAPSPKGFWTVTCVGVRGNQLQCPVPAMPMPGRQQRGCWLSNRLDN